VSVHFVAGAWDDFVLWHQRDPDIAKKICLLIDDIRRSPFQGLDKPEPLRGDLKGWWSRRIDREHRLIYAVRGKPGEDQCVVIAQCRDHYE